MIAIALLLAAGTAEAGHKLFVLRADSTTDWGTRTHVEKTVLGLARNVDRGASRGDMTLADLALSAGCTKGLDGCRGALLDALMIDELVVVTIAPSGDDKVKVTVRRASRAGIREATALVDKADPDGGLVASIGPLFGAHRIVGERPAPSPPRSKGTMTIGTVEVDNERPPEPRSAPTESKPAPEARKPAPEATSAPAATPAPAAKPALVPASEPVAMVEPGPSPAVTAAPDNIVDTDHGRRPIYVGGMVAGGVAAVIGIVLWQKASSLEADARVAPARTSAEIASLLDLESSGDHYALAGNIAFFGGLAIAGASGYLFWRSRDGRVTPMAVDHGGGVALSFEVP